MLTLYLFYIPELDCADLELRDISTDRDLSVVRIDYVIAHLTSGATKMKDDRKNPEALGCSHVFMLAELVLQHSVGLSVEMARCELGFELHTFKTHSRSH